MSTNFTRLIGLLLLLGIFAAAVLLMMPVTAPAPDVETVTPIPNAPGQAYPPPGGSTPLPTIAYAYPPPDSTQSAAMRAPLCQFSGGNDTVPEVSNVALEDYVFSEPRVVLTSTTPLGIVDWLPDNERLLLTNYLPNSGDQAIETFNTLKREIQVYAEITGGGMPIWLPALDAVAYATTVYDERLPRGGRQELRVSYGNPQQVEVIAADVYYASLTTDGERLLFFDRAIGDQPQAWSFSTRSIAAMALDLTNHAYQKIATKPPPPGATFQIVFQPGGQWLAFYGYSLLYLADTYQTAPICEIDLGERLAYNVQWSPDGRYLAFLSATYNLSSLLFTSSEIVILDITTGEQVHLDLEVSYVYEIDWGPDSRTLIALVQMDVTNGYPYKGLFLVDALGGDARHVLPDHIFGGNPDGEMSWSPDGKVIAIDCTRWPTETVPVEGRVCLIDVTLQP